MKTETHLFNVEVTYLTRAEVVRTWSGQVRATWGTVTEEARAAFCRRFGGLERLSISVTMAGGKA